MLGHDTETLRNLDLRGDHDHPFHIAMGPDTCRDTGVCKGRERVIKKELRDPGPHLISFPIRPCDFLVIDVSGYLLRCGTAVRWSGRLQGSSLRASARTELYTSCENERQVPL